MEWKEVWRRRHSGSINRVSVWSERTGKNVGENDETSSFFFTEFQESYGAKDMAGIFKEHGIVKEVFIPAMRDKREKRYHFVRYRNVKEERLIAAKLDSIQIKGRKIFVNVPRFKRGGEAKDINNRNMERKVQDGVFWPAIPNRNGTQCEKSYAQAVRTNRFGEDMAIGDCHTRSWKKNMVEKPSFSHLQFNIELSEIVRFEKAFVGEVKKTGSTYNIQDVLNAEGFFHIKATSLGANLFLVEESEEGAVRLLIQEEVEWISQWFWNIHLWSPEDIDNERLTWIKCFGLPCQAWKHEFFKFISGSVEEYVCCNEEMEIHKYLDVARFLVKTKYSMSLSKVFNVDINGKVYKIKLMEDYHGPKIILVSKESTIEIDSEVEETNDEDEGETEKLR